MLNYTEQLEKKGEIYMLNAYLIKPYCVSLFCITFLAMDGAWQVGEK